MNKYSTFHQQQQQQQQLLNLLFLHHKHKRCGEVTTKKIKCSVRKGCSYKFRKIPRKAPVPESPFQ